MTAVPRALAARAAARVAEVRRGSELVRARLAETREDLRADLAAHRARRRRAPGAGRLPSLGQDHDAGHREYVGRLEPGVRRWLETKPFSAPPDYELSRCLHGFAHAVDALGLGRGAEVLDVGCGPGWASEWLARCGYRVTGVDVSPDMVAVARERLARITGVPGGLREDHGAELHAMPVTDMPWRGRFDAAIAYDAMHHFSDEHASLAAIRRVLAPGGRLFVYEGVRPPPGSEAERELQEEMRRYGTLESPFDPEYLVDVVRGAGFTDLRRHVEVDRLVDLDDPAGESRRLRATMRAPTTNTLVAAVPLGDPRPGAAATIAAAGPPERTPGGGVELVVRLENTGRTRWVAALPGAWFAGAVNLGPFVRLADGARRELPRVPLPKVTAPGERAEVAVRLDAADLAGAGVVSFDLVCEGAFWFESVGTTPLTVTL